MAIALIAPAAQALDESLYARLLSKHTQETRDEAGVRVDYDALHRDPDWAALLAGLGSHTVEVPTDRAGTLAFWINAYNIVVIETVARAWPVESIRDVGSPIRPVWYRREVVVAGAPRSLDEIEHEILRPMGEPRIHAALVCASVSCPTLRREPWQAALLDAQLEAAMTGWLRDPRKGARLDRRSKRIRLSRVFDWFVEDFGGSEADVLRFVSARLPEADGAWLRANADTVDVDHFEYDWRLNGLRARTAAPAAQVPGR